MKKIDFIIVGCGLAGIALCEYLKERGRSFSVYEDKSQNSSSVAAGMYNPVILKRFTPVWKAAEQLELAIPFYEKIQKELGIKLDYQFPLYRRFASIEEQNMWFNAADRPRLEPFLNLNLKKNTNDYIEAAYDMGEVKHAGRVHTSLLVSEYRKHLTELGLLNEEQFMYHELTYSRSLIQYQNTEAKYIVFSEGFGLKNNPFFKYLPLTGTKGEVLTVRIKDLKLKHPIKSAVFLIPLGNDEYRVGATYNNSDKTNQPTTIARDELLEKLKTFVKLPIEVVDQKAGIRPTVKDRRPLVGRHPENPNMYVLNGMGSRGVMIAPYAAKQLLNFIESGSPIDPEMDITRFKTSFPNPDRNS